MADDAETNRSTRFKPGETGNRKGRPRKQVDQPASLFDELRARKISLQIDGTEREFSLAEALLYRTLQQALAGKRMAIRTILKRIQAHEAAKAPTARHLPKILFEHDKPQAVDHAMLILGIASEVPDTFPMDGRSHLALEPWAVAGALARGQGRRLSNKKIQELKRKTRDPESVAWPPGAEA